MNNSKCQLIMSDQQNCENSQTIYHSISNLDIEPNKVRNSPCQQSIDLHVENNRSKRVSEREDTLFKKTETQKSQRSKSFQQILIYFHLQTFIKKMLLKIRPDSSFSKKHFHLINDKASSYKNQNHQNTNYAKKGLITQYMDLLHFSVKFRLSLRQYKSQLKRFVQNQYFKIPLIQPNSNYKFIWDVLLFINRVYIIIVIPIVITFQNTRIATSQSKILIVISLLLLFDIILRAFTISFDKGVPIKDRKILFQKQLNKMTYMEVLSLVISLIICVNLSDFDMYFVMEEDGWPKLFLLGLYLQINSILLMLANVQYSLKPSKEINSLIELVKMVCLIVVIQHFCCCIWVIIGESQIRANNPSWISRLEFEAWPVKYLESLYFMSVTMFTVGYGDISPLNTYEKIFCICYMFLSTLQLSYSVNIIGSILTQIKENNEKIRQKMTFINEYLHDKQISQNLQYKYEILSQDIRVREYCNFYLKQDIVERREEQAQIISMLPEDLQLNIRLEAASVLIEKCPFIKNFSKNTIDKIIQDSHYISYQPGIMLPKSVDDFKIYIIEYGEVQLVKGKSSVRSFGKNDYFGLEEFMSNQVDHMTNYKTKSFVSLLVISQKSLVKILKEDPNELEIYCKIIYGKKYIKYCQICQNGKHQTKKCKLVHFIPDKEKVVKQYLMFQSQYRDIYQRKKGKFRTLLGQCILEDIQQIFQTDQDQIIDKLSPDLQTMIPTVMLNDDSFQKSECDLDRIMPRNRMEIGKFQNYPHKRSISPNEGSSNLDIQVYSEESTYKELNFKMQNISRFTEGQQRDIEFWFKRMSNLRGSIDDSFEQVKTYTIFSKSYNINNTIRRNKEITKTINYDSTKQRQYLLFIWPFIKKFHLRKIRKTEFKRKQEKKSSYFEQLKQQQSNMKKKIVRGKSRQIHPIKQL